MSVSFILHEGEPSRAPASFGWPFARGVGLAIVVMLTMVLGVGCLAHLHIVASQVPLSEPVAARWLSFEDRPDLGVTVRDAKTDEVITVIRGEAGFLRCTIRGLVQQRQRDGLADTVPFRLTRWADGRLTLDDPPARRHVELEAFGPTNEGVFAGLLDASDHQP